MKINKSYSDAVKIAKEYYNSPDADNFYLRIWGGEHIHIGIYQSDGESIADASHRTVQHIASHLNLTQNIRVLDIGAGFGGASRFLANMYGYQVVALNLSEIENERHRHINKTRNLDQLIEVIDASFEEIPYPDQTFDLVWCQDALLHSSNHIQVFQEVNRVLTSGGDFIFTDPMQADNCPEGVLQPILDRIHLDSLGSPRAYRVAAQCVGMEEIGFDELTPHLVIHYSRILHETEKQENNLEKFVSHDYIVNMKRGLQYWIDGGKKDYLVWGIFHFRKN
ncbi:methyltransferase domain-containing protein [Thermodesulfobacteriota bacterium]